MEEYVKFWGSVANSDDKVKNGGGFSVSVALHRKAARFGGVITQGSHVAFRESYSRVLRLERLLG